MVTPSCPCWAHEESDSQSFSGMHLWAHSQKCLQFPLSKESHSGIEIWPHNLPVLCPALLQKDKSPFASPKPAYFHYIVGLLRRTTKKKKHWLSQLLLNSLCHSLTTHSLCLQRAKFITKETIDNLHWAAEQNGSEFSTLAACLRPSTSALCFLFS